MRSVAAWLAEMIRTEAVWMSVVVHDGIGIWLASRRLDRGRFAWPKEGATVSLSRGQFDALVLGLPWQRLGEDGVIRLL